MRALFTTTIATITASAPSSAFASGGRVDTVGLCLGISWILRNDSCRTGKYRQCC